MTAGHADWRFVGLGDYAWFGASSHAHAASLAGLIVDVFPGGVSLPDMDVRADGVRVGVGAGLRLRGRFAASGAYGTNEASGRCDNESVVTALSRGPKMTS